MQDRQPGQPLCIGPLFACLPEEHRPALSTAVLLLVSVEVRGAAHAHNTFQLRRRAKCAPVEHPTLHVPAARPVPAQPQLRSGRIPFKVGCIFCAVCVRSRPCRGSLLPDFPC